jgi:type VI protein secretion system component VasK
VSKKKKSDGDEPAARAGVSIAAHPRAKAAVRRARARTGLAAFVVVLLLSLHAGVPGQDAALRAVAAGLVGNLIGWACALAVWRQIVMQEVRLVGEARQERARARAEARAAAAQAAAADAAATN